jgi:hypothetical protein
MYCIDIVGWEEAASICTASRSLGASTAMLTPTALAALAPSTPGAL